MSYTIQEAQLEQDKEINEALDKRDSEALYQLAQILKEQGDDEQAESLLITAKQIDQEEDIIYVPYQHPTPPLLESWWQEETTIQLEPSKELVEWEDKEVNKLLN